MSITNTEVIIIPKIVKYFSESLIKEIKGLQKTLISLGLNVNKSIPAPFNSNYISINAYYSIDRNQYFIVFNEAKYKDDFSFMMVKGNPVPINCGL